MRNTSASPVDMPYTSTMRPYNQEFDALVVMAKEHDNQLTKL